MLAPYQVEMRGREDNTCGMEMAPVVELLVVRFGTVLYKERAEASRARKGGFNQDAVNCVLLY